MPPPIASGGPCSLLVLQVRGQRINASFRQTERPARLARLGIAALANRPPYLDRRRQGRIVVRRSLQVHVIPRQGRARSGHRYLVDLGVYIEVRVGSG